MRIKIHSLLVVFMFLYGTAMGQNDDSTVKKDDKNLKITALPVFFFLPGTGFGFGGLGVSTFRLKNEPENSRRSSLQLNASYTTKNQILLFAPYEIYWDDEKWRLFGTAGFFRFSYNFFGVGINSQETDLETYDVDFPRLRANLLREVSPGFSLGIGYEFDNYTNLRIDEDGILQSVQLPGNEDGGTVSNIGALAVYDTRDNIFFPTKGFFVQGSYFTSVSFLGAGFDYTKLKLDARYYQKLKGQHILAFNFFLADHSEGTPFFDYNFLGADRTRGFNDRRFLDLAEFTIASEYRFPIYRRIGGVVFGSTATVAPSLDEVFSSKFVNAAGVGLRYIINTRDGIRVRADYGLTREGGNVYLTIREAF